MKITYFSFPYICFIIAENKFLLLPLTCFSLRMKSVSKSQKRVATTQVQVSVGISREEASEAPAQTHRPQIHLSAWQALMLPAWSELHRTLNIVMKLKKDFYFQIRSFLNGPLAFKYINFSSLKNCREIKDTLKITINRLKIVLYTSKWGHCVFTVTPLSINPTAHPPH